MVRHKKEICIIDLKSTKGKKGLEIINFFLYCKKFDIIDLKKKDIESFELMDYCPDEIEWIPVWLTGKRIPRFNLNHNIRIEMKWNKSGRAYQIEIINPNMKLELNDDTKLLNLYEFTSGTIKITLNKWQNILYKINVIPKK